MQYRKILLRWVSQTKPTEETERYEMDPRRRNGSSLPLGERRAEAPAAGDRLLNRDLYRLHDIRHKYTEIEEF